MLSKQNQTVAFVSTVALLAFGFIAYMAYQEAQEYHTAGVRTSATILRKYMEVTTRTHRFRTIESESPCIEVYYFKEKEKKAERTPKDTTPIDIDKVLADLAKTLKSGGTKSISAKLYVTDEDYAAYKTGDKIDIIYLKSDSSKAKIAKYIE